MDATTVSLALRVDRPGDAGQMITQAPSFSPGRDAYDGLQYSLEGMMTKFPVVTANPGHHSQSWL